MFVYNCYGLYTDAKRNNVAEHAQHKHKHKTFLLMIISRVTEETREQK